MKTYFKSSSYIASSCRSAPKRLMLILDEKWEVQKSIYKSTYLFLGISVAIVSRKGITLFGYMYHP